MSESSNARQGIKTNSHTFIIDNDIFRSESSNARQGIKTYGGQLMDFGGSLSPNHRMPVRALRPKLAGEELGEGRVRIIECPSGH